MSVWSIFQNLRKGKPDMSNQLYNRDETPQLQPIEESGFVATPEVVSGVMTPGTVEHNSVIDSSATRRNPSIFEKAEKSNTSEIQEDKTLKIPALQPNPPSSTTTSRPVSVIAEEYEKALMALEDLSTSGDEYYAVWLEENKERLRGQSTIALRLKTQEAITEVSRLQSEFESVTTGMARRLAAVRNLTSG